MSRHSKHSNDRSYYSHKERQDAGFAGCRKEILGSDCFLPFGSCALTLKAAKDPVATPNGWIYDKAAILESFLTQKTEIAANKKKYEEQEKRRQRREQSAKLKEDQQDLQKFTNAEQGLLSQDARHKRVLERADDENPNKKQGGLRNGELMIINKVKLCETSFWAPESTKNAAPNQMAKPPEDDHPKCPMSGKKLRMKDLITVNFEIADHDMLKAGGGKGVYCCAISKHPITHQQAVLIKPSGQVVLESVVKDCVLKDMVCPISGKKLSGPKDIMKLQQGGTGFSAHNEIEAKSFSHIRSFDGDNRTQSGHLPAAGYAGLR